MVTPIVRVSGIAYPDMNTTAMGKAVKSWSSGVKFCKRLRAGSEDCSVPWRAAGEGRKSRHSPRGLTILYYGLKSSGAQLVQHGKNIGYRRRRGVVSPCRRLSARRGIHYRMCPRWRDGTEKSDSR